MSRASARPVPIWHRAGVVSNGKKESLRLHTPQIGIAVIDVRLNIPNGIEIKADIGGLLFHLALGQALEVD